MSTTAERFRTFWGERQFDRARLGALTRYWEIAVYGVLLSAALGLRLWHLDARAIHHDESLHMYYAWQLFQGQGYEHVPFMHGPLKFFATALTFRLFGDNDFTARLPFALAGTAMVGLPYFLRKYIGRAGAIIAALVLAVSPTLLYVSRFNRDDILITAYTLAMVIVMWRYLKEQRESYLYAVPLLLMLGFTTMEVTFITTAIFLIYLEYQLANDLLDQLRASRALEPVDEVAAFTVFFVFGWAIAILWPFLEGRPQRGSARYILLLPLIWYLDIVWSSFWSSAETLRKRWSLSVMPASAHLLVIIVAFALPMFAAAVQKLPFHIGTPNEADAGLDNQTLKIIATLSFLAVSMYIGLLWNWRIWTIGALIFFVPFVLLYTTFLTNPGGFWTGIWGSLDYWLSQQLVRRGSQPDYYYTMFLPVYEFLPLIFALGGAFFYAFRGKRQQQLLSGASLVLVIMFSILPGTPPLIGEWWKVAFVIAIATVLFLKMDGFTKFLLFWTLSMFFALSIAGEKMPWLIVHITLPLAILAAKVADDVLSSLGAKAAELSVPARQAGRLTRAAQEAPVRSSPALERVAPLAAAGALALIAAIIFQWVGPGSPISVIAWLLAVVTALVVAWTAFSASPQHAGVVAATALFAALFVFTVRAAGTAAFDQGDPGDYPHEMLVYAQGSPALNVLRDDIGKYADDSGQGLSLPVVIDQSVNIWPWPWILRHREGKGLQYESFSGDFVPPDGAVVLISSNNRSKMQPYLDRYQPGIPYTHMWWFPEFYKNFTPQQGDYEINDFLGRLFKGHYIPIWRHYFIDRTVLGASAGPDMVAYFPKGSQITPPTTTQTPSANATDLATGAVTVIGASGQFSQPADVARDAQGNVYVVDTLNHKVQRFAPDGTATSFGAQGTGDGQFGNPRLQGSEYPEDGPWGIAVDAQGNIYVADTWSHRVEKFGPDLKFIKTWGAGELFGPRDIAIDAQGNVYVVDTGNKRVRKYSADGQLLGNFGQSGNGSGSFDEPTSISITPNGDIYVADYWNKRIQHFDASFHYKDEIKVSSWGSRNINERAYIVALADGHVLATDPAGARILVFDASGKEQAAWRLPSTSGTRPIGIAVDEGSGVAYISDGLSSQVVRVPLATLLGPTTAQ